MRFIHTADWHLGRLFHGVHLTDDQHVVLDQLVRLVADARADALIVAGDVYDRAVPPPEAVALLDEVLSRVVLDLKTPVILIAGNHDGADRLAFGSRILAERGLHVVSAPERVPVPIPLVDAWGVVEVFASPYADPATMRERLGRDDLHDHDTAFGAWVERVRAARSPLARTVVVAHAFVVGGTACDSERPLSVGGAGTVGASHFDGFAYAALGHLHRPQTLSGRPVAYSGSLLKYSFSEAEHVKSVSVVEIDERGTARVERVALAPRRDLRCIEGRFDEILRRAAVDPARGDYLRVTLLDREVLLDPMGKLRAVYPNVLEIERPALSEAATASGDAALRRKREKLGDVELFEAFFHEVTGEPLDAVEREMLTSVMVEAERREREEAAAGEAAAGDAT